MTAVAHSTEHSQSVSPENSGWLTVSAADRRFIGRSILNAMHYPEPWMEFGVNLEETLDPALPQIASVIVTHRDSARTRVLMLQRLTQPFAGYWSIPGGHKQPDESYRAAGVRELGEESGIYVPPDQLLDQYTFINKRSRIESHVFHLPRETADFQNIEEHEHAHMSYMERGELQRLKLIPGLELALLGHLEA